MSTTDWHHNHRLARIYLLHRSIRNKTQKHCPEPLPNNLTIHQRLNNSGHTDSTSSSRDQHHYHIIYLFRRTLTITLFRVKSIRSRVCGLSVQIAAARVRRKRINDKTQELGRLIPDGGKNIAEMLQEGHKYARYLHAQMSILELDTFDEFTVILM
ncbi:Transcription factor bHLH52 [Platanthera guangdongensis]|uniref:Transcription factor bHLH52 n=1 Tax=Platanthera guangdongensis TaxID=2320717 RepID=A0ABR2MV05_9ASPA